MNTLIGSSLSPLVGWSLLHFVWQGTLIAIAIWMLLAIVPARKSNLRYAVACLGLLVMAICPTATMLLMSHSQTATTRVVSISIQRPTMIQSVTRDDPNAYGKAAKESGSVAAATTHSRPESNDAMVAGANDPSGVSIDSDSPAVASAIDAVFESSTRFVTPAIYIDLDLGGRCLPVVLETDSQLVSSKANTAERNVDPRTVPPCIV